MDRWKMSKLKEISSVDFAIAILRERREKITPYSPLGVKIAEAQMDLAKMANDYSDLLREFCLNCETCKDDCEGCRWKEDA